MSGRRKETTLGQDEPDSRRRERERAATLVTTTPVAGAPRHLRRFIRLLASLLQCWKRSIGGRGAAFGCRTMRASDSLATAARAVKLACGRGRDEAAARARRRRGVRAHRRGRRARCRLAGGTSTPACYRCRRRRRHAAR
ncbi:Os06g0516200 [Oryza sativa Japonica Group]|uniref:Os06g0516200 protein n=2 Tax=Oryza TaxID=4527 RepID=A0A0N7KM69_ORYSJ|nr:Os06g0516200 [Oryza sativa Japonica Group]